ncbi:hypothetical protein GCM10020331_042020 [Ectobacillus funiculus]
MIGWTIAGLLAVGGAGMLPTAKAEAMYGKFFCRMARGMSILLRMANHFGIATEGKKSDEQLKAEIHQALEKKKHREHLLQKAKEFGIATEGKTAEQIHNEIRKLHESDLLEEAKRFGIATTGKSHFSAKRRSTKKARYAQEHEQLVQSAKEFGIATEGKKRTTSCVKKL